MTAAATADPATERVLALFERLPALVEANADLVRRGRFLTTDFALVVGATPLLVRVAAGRVTSVARGPFLLRPWTFSITAAPETWLPGTGKKLRGLLSRGAELPYPSRGYRRPVNNREGGDASRELCAEPDGWVILRLG
jgi:hypothetical protein